MKKILSILVFLCGFTQFNAFASTSRDREIQAALNEFRADPAHFMSQLPKKFRVGTTHAHEGNFSHFSKSQIESGDFIHERYEWRSRTMKRPLGHGLAEIANNDRAEDLVEDPDSMIRDPKQMDLQHLTMGSSQLLPWSDDYWPYYAGILGNRYGDPQQPRNQDWKSHYAFVTSPGHLFSEIWGSHDAVRVGQLSPAEKYDALTGNLNTPLTTTLWNVGRDLVNAGTPVEYWMGICDGWTSAAIRTERPVHTVTVPAADGTPLTFYPFDVKALNSLLWEWTGTPIRFIGTRCDIKNPAVDANGRIIDPACFDTNPGTWHLAVVQQVGKLGKSMIMDATYDYEIWNQPIRSYRYSYFNPQTGAPVQSIDAARVARKDFTQDKFAKYRSASAVTYVGIAMDLTYVAENENPTQIQTDSPQNDYLTTVRYLYDLELDAQDQIIGGEWYQNAHPDFLWMPEPGDEPQSYADNQVVGDWDGSGPVPAQWAAPAASSAYYGEPLSKVVKTLTGLSAK